MRQIFTLLLLLSSLLSFGAPSFLDSYKNRENNKEDQLLIFYKPDCPYCVNMDKALNSDADLRDAVTQKFNVKTIDISSAEGRMIADKFDVHSVPMIISYNNSTGGMLRINGFRSAKFFAEKLGIQYVEKQITENKPTAVCGDGIVGAGEACDDGNTTNGDGCSGTCTIQPGFFCSGNPSICNTACGDGLVAGTEQCDDGNTTDGDGCTGACTVQPGFQCSGTPSICGPLPVCGNGAIEPGEQCDDANIVGGDGCSASCTLETPPANDNCTGAISLTGTTGNVNSDNSFATNSTGVPAPTCQASISADMWYKFTLASSKQCYFGLNGGSITDAVLTIYSGNCASLTEVACSDDVNGSNFFSLIQTTLNAGTYYVRAGTYSTSAKGTFNLNYNLNGSTYCGNGAIESGEECDDGNTNGGDGCSSACKFENSAAIKGVAINTDQSRSNPSAMLDVKSEDRGVLIPRMTSVKRTAIASPAKGLLVFDLTTNSFWFHNGQAWSEFGATIGAIGGGLPAPTALYQTLYTDGSKWLVNDALLTNGSAIQIDSVFYITSGNPGTGKVLTSADDNGNAVWAIPSYDSSRNTGFYVQTPASQTFSSTFLPTLSSEVYDDGNAYSGNFFTAPATGVYQLNAQGNFSFTGLTTQASLTLLIEDNLGNNFGSNTAIIPIGYVNSYVLEANTVVKLIKGTKVQVRVFVTGPSGSGSIAASQTISTVKFRGVRLY